MGNGLDRDPDLICSDPCARLFLSNVQVCLGVSIDACFFGLFVRRVSSLRASSGRVDVPVLRLSYARRLRRA